MLVVRADLDGVGVATILATVQVTVCPEGHRSVDVVIVMVGVMAVIAAAMV